MLRVGHYINQFFAGIGGEQSANLTPQGRDGPVGPGRALQLLLKNTGGVVYPLICGESFFNERDAEARTAVRAWIDVIRLDLGLAGPGFAARSYGVGFSEA